MANPVKLYPPSSTESRRPPACLIGDLAHHARQIGEVGVGQQ
jgi:hypothetical protein